MKRLLTAAVGIPLALAAVFWLPETWFFVVALAVILAAVVEFIRLCRPRAADAPLWMLPILVAVAAVALGPQPRVLEVRKPESAELVIWALLLSVGIGTLVLLARTPPEQSLGALGAFAFGIPYFSLPVASLYHLQREDPWVLFLLLAVVWVGDAAALYGGTLWGRHKMAPVVSPHKTWEGAVAGFVVGVLVAVVWSYVRLGRLSASVVALGAVVAVVAQLGDLVESLIKRGVGVKDSGNLLPGHGGILDRLDALLFSAPVMLLGYWLAGEEVWLQ